MTNGGSAHSRAGSETTDVQRSKHPESPVHSRARGPPPVLHRADREPPVRVGRVPWPAGRRAAIHPLCRLHFAFPPSWACRAPQSCARYPRPGSAPRGRQRAGCEQRSVCPSPGPVSGAPLGPLQPEQRNCLAALRVALLPVHSAASSRDGPRGGWTSGRARPICSPHTPAPPARLAVPARPPAVCWVSNPDGP